MAKKSAYILGKLSVSQASTTKAFKVIDDPEAFQLLADETRRRVVYLLRAKERTVSQVAEELDLTPQAIYHHIRKLRDAGMVEVAREERVDHFIETYYRATAEVFHLAHGKGGSKEFNERQTRDVLENLARLGVKVRTDPESISRIVDLQNRIEGFGSESELTDKLEKLGDIDFITRQGMFHYAKLLTMSNEEFEEQAKLLRELRKLLKSSIVEVAKA